MASGTAQIRRSPLCFVDQEGRTVNGSVSSDFFLPCESVIFNSSVNLPGRLSDSKNLTGIECTLAGTSFSMVPVNALARVGLPFSSRTRNSKESEGCLVDESRTKPTTRQLSHIVSPAPKSDVETMPSGSLVV